MTSLTTVPVNFTEQPVAYNSPNSWLYGEKMTMDDGRGNVPIIGSAEQHYHGSLIGNVISLLKLSKRILKNKNKTERSEGLDER